MPTHIDRWDAYADGFIAGWHDREKGHPRAYYRRCSRRADCECFGCLTGPALDKRCGYYAGYERFSYDEVLEDELHDSRHNYFGSKT